MSDEPCGLLLVDKPAGPTSHDVVARLRRALGIRRIGHAGTLDPPATGLLVVGVGRATRLLRFVTGQDKDYTGELVLGTTTTTLDATGEITATYEMSGITDEQVAAAAAALTGELDQVPPMVSAVSVGGRRLHELAREGKVVERPARRVRVGAYRVSSLGQGRYSFFVTCTSGTYVRALVDDLGRALGGGAHLASLRRTRIGALSLDEATPLATLEAMGRDAPVAPPAAMVATLERVVVDDAGRLDLLHGRRLRVEGRAPSTAEVAVLDATGALVGVARDDGTGLLRPDVVLASGGEQPRRD